MIQNSIGIFLVLLVIESFVLWASTHAKSRNFFRFVPAVFWIYFLPMLASTFGIISPQSPLYGWVVTFGLPASLFLLLLGVDLKAISQLGRKAVVIFVAGSFGVMLGAVISFGLFRSIVGDAFWQGFGTLSASWMGGSANMLAVKEAIGTPDNIFLPIVVVDTIIPYAWMGALIFLSNWQSSIDRFNKADVSLLDNIRRRMASIVKTSKVAISAKSLVGLLGMAFVVGFLINRMAMFLPVVQGIISQFTWTIILVSVLGLLASLTPLRKLEAGGSTKIGYFMLYFVLTTIGAKASVVNLGASAVLLVAGCVIVLVHAGVLFLTIRFLKAPVMLAAAASQANLGGVASAPVVAEIYGPGLSAIGLLMAVLGNIIGTYLGILASQMCRWVTLF